MLWWLLVGLRWESPVSSAWHGRLATGRMRVETVSHGRKIQFSVAVAERASSHHWECVVWTHPESPPLQVALINHADMALTLFYLPWRNPVLPAPQTLLWWQERLNEVLVVAGGGLTGLWPPELWSGDLG